MRSTWSSHPAAPVLLQTSLDRLLPCTQCTPVINHQQSNYERSSSQTGGPAGVQRGITRGVAVGEPPWRQGISGVIAKMVAHEVLN